MTAKRVSLPRPLRRAGLLCAVIALLCCAPQTANAAVQAMHAPQQAASAAPNPTASTNARVPNYGMSASRSRVDRRIDALSESTLWYADPQTLADPLRARVTERVARIRRPLFFVYAGLQIGLLFWIWRSGRAGGLRDWYNRRIPNRSIARIAYIATLAAATEIIGFPASAVGYRILHDVGIATQGTGAWLYDFARAGLLQIAGVTFVLAVILELCARTRIWYLWSAAFVVCVGAVLSFVYPLCIMPLFHPATPIDVRSPVYRRLALIEDRAKVGRIPIFITELSRTTAVGNAMVAGIGPSRRVLIGDTLLQKATLPEVAFVMAHELGHEAHEDPIRLLFITNALLLLAATAAVIIADRVRMRSDDDAVSRLPLVIAIFGLCSLVIFPLGNGYSRTFEAEADRFALKSGEDGTAAARVFVRFADEGFAPICPPQLVRWYFYDHPPLGTRIAAATDRPDPCP